MPDHGTPDPIARLIRERRVERGMSLRALAAAASARMLQHPGARRAAAVSTGYLSLIENGLKVPDEAVAVAIAGALGADQALFRAWIAARKRADLGAALAAAETLRAFRGAASPAPGPGLAGVGAAAGVTADAPLVVLAAPPPHAPSAPLAPPHTRLRVPVIGDGDDPGDGVRPSCVVLEWRALDAASLSDEARGRLARPFAIRLAGAAADVGLAPGDHVLVLRALAELPPESVCAVRAAERVVLRRVTWDGRRALLLPARGGRDFEVVDAPSADALAARVLGIARRIAFGT